MPSDPAHRSGGFTLLEVLVALAIVGLGLVAVFGQLNQTLIAASIMRDRTLAHWVAMNRLAELRLSGELPDVGERSDEVEMGGVEWSYELKFSEVGLENIRRVDVAVSFADSPDRVVTELIGILGQSPQQAAPTVWTPLDPNAEFAGGEQQ
jgi:general secretion pathway protein I